MSSNLELAMSLHSDSLGTDPPPPPPSKPKPSNFSCPPRQTKKTPDNFNTLNMFNNNTYTNFKTAHKHMLILWWCLARELFGSQIPVTTGGFEQQISWIWSNYLTHYAIRPNREDGFTEPECKGFAVQTLLW